MTLRPPSVDDHVSIWSRTALIAAFTAFLLVLGTAFSPAATALEPGNGELTGTLTVGSLPANASVGIYAEFTEDGEDWTWWEQLTSVETDGSGHWSAELPAGTYRVCYWDHGTTFESTCEGADNVDEATDFVINDGDSTSVNRNLPRAATIAGRVTAPGGAGLQGTDVAVYQLQEEDGETWWDTVGWASTDETGAYKVVAPTGGVRIGFQDYTNTYEPEFWNDAPSLEEATTLNLLTAQQKTGVNAQLAVAPTISGTVTNAADEPLGDISISVYVPREGGGWRYDEERGSSTSVDGTYRVAVPAGDVRLRFEDWSGAYLPEFWNNAITVRGADTITAAAGQAVTGKDAVLAPASTISGTVTLPEGITGESHVEIYSDGGDWKGYTSVDPETGEYTIGGLRAGSYVAQFVGAEGALSEYWNDKKTFDNADRITLTAQEDRTGIDATLAKGGTITGRLLDKSGAPLAGCWVSANDDEEVWSSTQTEGDGTFSIRGLPTSTVQVAAEGRACGNFSMYYDGDATLTDDYRDATGIAVTAGATTELGDLTLLLRASLAGKLTLPEGATVQDRTVRVLTSEGWRRAGRADESGNWTVTGIAAGTVRLGFGRLSGPALTAPSFYDGVAEGSGWSAGTPITVALGDQVTGLDATPAVGGTVSGVLKNTSGQPLVGCRVLARSTPGAEPRLVSRSADTSATGAFTITGLSTGDYQLMVFNRRDDESSPCQGPAQFAAGTAGGPMSYDASTAPLHVTRGAALRISNPLVYGKGGAIAGTLALPAGATEEDGTVLVFDAQGHYAGETWAEGGAYRVDGLAPGTYHVRFGRLSGGGNAAAELYDEKDPFGQVTGGTAVTVTGEGTTTVNESLVAGGKIAGNLVDGAGEALTGCDVGVFHGEDYMTTAETDETGAFTVTGLPQGQYTVTVDNGGECDEGRRWVQNGGGALGGPGAADLVTVDVGQTTTLAPALVYGPGAVITGTVTGISTGDGLPVEIVDTATGTVVAEDWLWSGGQTYELGGLAPGTYRIEYGREHTISDRAGSFYNGKNEELGAAAATPVTLTAGETFTAATQALGLGGTIQVDLTDATGAPIEECYLEASDPTEVRSTRSNDGSGSVRGLSTGGYVLEVFCYDRVAEDGVRRYYVGAGKPMTTDPARAGLVDVTRGQTTAISMVYADGPAIGNTALPQVSGQPVVGQTLTATGDSWSTADVTRSYQWLADGAAIAGATQSTYAVVAANEGKTLAVRVTATKADYKDGVATSAATAKVTKPVIANTTKPAISGDPSVGQTLTASAGTWSPAPGTTAYQWLANGTAISGATASTYVVKLTDVGKAISVRVTASKPDHVNGVATSEPVTATAQPVMTSTVPPTITGTPQAGQVLTAEPGTWTPSGGSFAYRWRADGTDIAGATAKTFTIPLGAPVGTKLSVRVTATKTGAVQGTATSAEVTTEPRPISNVTKPVVSGTPAVGSVLTTTLGTWNPSEVGRTIKWFAGGAEIVGATGTSYQVQQADLGKKITVVVTATKAGYTTVTATSEPTAVVTPRAIRSTGRPTISGTPQFGQTLTTTAGTWDVEDVAASYQWFANGTAISGATASSLVLPASVVGKQLTVQVTAVKSGYSNGVASSLSTSAIAPQLFKVASGSFTMTGKLRVGKILRTTVPTMSPTATVGYQWYRGSTAIKGATKSSYKIVRADRRRKLTVKVTFSKPGYKTIVAQKTTSRRVR